MAMKILIGGSPCTKWSIAQRKDRETKAEGEGWELFLNYLIAKEKFKPDLFLYENNKSASQEIKDQIAKELGVGTDENARFTYINSALVSAQNRQRFYVTNFGDIEQPEDRGILLRDILIGGATDRDKARAVISSAGRTTTREYFQKNQGNMALEPVLFQEPRGKNKGGAKTEKSPTMTDSFWQENVKKFEPVNPLASGKARCVTAGYANKGSKHILESNFSDNPSKQTWDSVAEPVNVTSDGKSQTIKAQYQNTNEQNICCYKSTFGASGVGEPVKVGCMPSPDGTIKNGQAMRIYSTEGKSSTLSANGGGMGGKTGLYAIPVDETEGYAVAVEWDEEGTPTKAQSGTDGKIYRVYKVENGLICIKGKMYEINLLDGYWIIRKLTVVECARLQTMPDDYCRAVSDSQAYKALGNGWTAEVIIHLLEHALKDVPKDEEIVVLSMYDGIATGRYCLEKMGFTNVTYHAYEIDPYAKKVAMDNYPDIIQHGNAYDIRLTDWKLEK